MIFFLWNLLLALFWASITGELNLRNILAGFLIGFIVLVVTEKALGVQSYSLKTYRLIHLLLMVFIELIKSSLKIAYDIVTPQHHMRPGILKIPLDAKTIPEITCFSNLLSLTPGTLSLDISPDQKYIYVHFMYIYEDDIEEVKMNLKRHFEAPVLELLR